MAPSQRPFSLPDPELTAIAIGHKATSITAIADLVIPPGRALSRREYKYWELKPEEFLTVPDAAVGRLSRPNEVSFSGELKTDIIDDKSLMTKVPRSDEQEAGDGYDPLRRATVGLQELHYLKKEKDCADMIFTATNYPVAQRTTLAGDSKWSSANSDPLRTLKQSMRAMLVPPNTLVLGHEAAISLQMNPKVVGSYFGNDGQYGMAPLAFIADFLGLSRGVFVGVSKVNTALPGTTPVYADCWGDFAALLAINEMSDPSMDQSMTTFGFCPNMGMPQVFTWFDNEIGAYGGNWVKASQSYSYKVTASNHGYLFSDVS